MITSPFEQFLITAYYFYNGNYILTDNLILLTLWLSLFFVLSYLCIGLTQNKLNYFNYVFGILYDLFYGIVKGYIGNYYFKRYFPFFFYVFILLWICNMISLLPFTFTLTSHFFFSLGLSATFWFSILFLGVSRYGLAYLRLYFPVGIATLLMFFLVVIETMSCLFRMFSLALRLIANMIAGHLLLDCLMIYVYNIIYKGVSFFSISVFSVLGLIVGILALTGLFLFELFVCFLQAYIFVMLSIIYLVEVL